MNNFPIILRKINFAAEKRSFGGVSRFPYIFSEKIRCYLLESCVKITGGRKPFNVFSPVTYYWSFVRTHLKNSTSILPSWKKRKLKGWQEAFFFKKNIHHHVQLSVCVDSMPNVTRVQLLLFVSTVQYQVYWIMWILNRMLDRRMQLVLFQPQGKP